MPTLKIMKKFLLLLIVCIYTLQKAQTYTFDYLFEIHEKRTTPNLIETSINKIAINSKDNTYILKLRNDGLGNLYDSKTKKLHQIKLHATNEDGVSIFNYISTSSNPIIEKDRFYTIKEIHENEYLIQSFSDVKKSNLLVETTIKVKELPYPALGLLLINGGNTLEKRNRLLLELNKILDPKKGYLIENEKMAFDTNLFATYKHKSAVKVNYSVIIP